MALREKLESMRVADLKAICKEKKIPHYNGKNCYNKTQLVEAIISAGVYEQTQESDAEGVKTEVEKANTVSTTAKCKMQYVENAPLGAIVAFRVPCSNVVKSAKIINRSAENRKLKLETSYGKQYVIDYDDVVWVRSGLRWPNGVLMALKSGKGC